MFTIHMGIPEMEDFWLSLSSRIKRGSASRDDVELYNKLGKTLAHLSSNPRHPGLKSHEIEILSKRYGMKVWQSYIENSSVSARRIFWVYGPGKSDITIIGLEPHPNDKKDSYKKINLSTIPVYRESSPLYAYERPATNLQIVVLPCGLIRR